MPESFQKPSEAVPPQEVPAGAKVTETPEQPAPTREFIIDTEEMRKARKQEKISLAKEVFGRNETFRFPGMSPEAYANRKNEDEEFPGYTTPTDELVERFNREGAKVVLGKNPASGNVFVIPAETGDIEMDNLSPRQLHMDEVFDEETRRLIRLDSGK